MADYVSSSPREIEDMLQAMGLEKLSDLTEHIDERIRLKDHVNIPEGLNEFQLLDKMEGIAAKNKVYPQIFRGAGAYRHYIPTVVPHLGHQAAFVTAYTPYQAEMSQGMLQAIFEYQTFMAELTGMDASNASVYDGATAVAESLQMILGRKHSAVLMSETHHPDVIRVVQTYAYGFELEIRMVPSKDGLIDREALQAMLTPEVAGLLIPQISYEGQIEDIKDIAAMVHDAKGKLVMSINPIAAAILPDGKDVDADVVVGDGGPLGLGLSFGGPTFGFMATTQKLTRSLPGRIVGQTVDKVGKRAFVLTLQAREQHIRREKASSSICSNQSLMTIKASIYLSALGTHGLVDVAQRCVDNAHYLAEQLSRLDGISLKHSGAFFHEFVTTVPNSHAILAALEKENILGGLPLSDTEILWCATEANSKDAMDQLVSILKKGV